MKSWKIGAIAGLIAGIVAGIVAFITNTIVLIIGLPNPATSVPTTNIPEIYILMGMIWGIIFGIIYSIACELIPGNNLSKGFFYGIIIFIITNFRDITFLISQWVIIILSLISWLIIGFFTWIVYGLILVILFRILLNKYGTPKGKIKIKSYDLMSGIHRGAIAGLVGGIAAFLSRVLGGIIGLFPVFWIGLEGGKITMILEDIPYLGLAGMHILMNMIWGTIFGAIYTKVYDLVPGKGVIKGLVYGLIFFLIASFRFAVYILLWGDLWWAWATGLIGFFNAFFFGLVLGVLYKPTK